MTELQEQTSLQPIHKETKWYDAWIRWEKGSKETYDDDEKEEDSDDEPPLVPTDTYHSSYEVNVTADTTNTINLELQGFASESEVIWTSTGLTLWKSSDFLCDFLVKHYSSLVETNSDKPCRILEVGSGLGRSGILMHLLAYASSKQEEEGKDSSCMQEVVLTDGDTDVLAQLRSNVEQNLELNSGLMENRDGSRDESKSDVSCHQLIWGKDHAKAFVNRPCFQTSPEDDYFDVMIGSDLIYVTQVIEPLFETVATLLRPKHGVFLMAHCARREGNEVDLEMVLDQAQKVGLRYTQLYPNDDKAHDHEEGIYLYRFEWPTKD